METIKASEAMAKRFHECYERLAPAYGYETRQGSRVPWDEVPEDNRSLMIAVCDELFNSDWQEEPEKELAACEHNCKTCKHPLKSVCMASLLRDDAFTGMLTEVMQVALHDLREQDNRWQEEQEKPANRQDQINKAGVKAHTELEERIESLAERLDEHTHECCKQCDETLPDETVPDEAPHHDDDGNEIEPAMPDGYLVLPEPAGKPVTETMMYVNSAVGEWQLATKHFDVGEAINATWYEGDFIDLAANVLPDAPAGTKLHEVKDGDYFKEGDYCDYGRGADWSPVAEGVIGGFIKSKHPGFMNQGYICRAVEEEEIQEIRATPKGMLPVELTVGYCTNDMSEKMWNPEANAILPAFEYLTESEPATAWDVENCILYRLAANVLPPLPDTHELVQRKPGMKWRSFDRAWNRRSKTWAGTIGSSWVGSKIESKWTNQGFFGRLKPVEEEPVAEEEPILLIGVPPEYRESAIALLKANGIVAGKEGE